MLFDSLSSISLKKYENKKNKNTKKKRTLRPHSIPLVLFEHQSTLFYLISVDNVFYERALVFMCLATKTTKVKCDLKTEDELKLLLLHQIKLERM